MANEDRRGGIGFGNQRGGGAPDVGDEAPEATRAMDLDDFEPAPTEYVAAPKPVPAAPRPAQPRPAPVAARPKAAPPPPPPEDEQATRMLDAIDYDPALGLVSRGAPLKPIELRVVSGPDRGKVHRVADGTQLVGRGLDCQIVLADPAVSRKHFKIERNGDEAVLVDLGGANGTIVNGQKRGRHLLEPGDHIDVGTTVLEVFVDGVGGGKQRAAGRGAPGSGVMAAAEVAEPVEQSKTGLAIGIAVAAVVILGAGGVGAWLWTSRAKAPATETAEAGAAESDDHTAEVAKLVKNAKIMMGDADFAEAIDELKKARKLDRGNKEVRELIASAQTEADNKDTFDDAKQAIRRGDFTTGIRLFGEINDKSVLHADAQDELSAAREAFFSTHMGDAKKFADSGDNAKAIAALDAILAMDPKRSEAKLMRAQLSATGEGDKPASGKAEDKAKAAKVAPHEAKQAAAAPHEAKVKEPKEEHPAAALQAGNKKAEFGPGLDAYHARNWSAAVKSFEEISSGPYPKEAKAKATGYAGAVKSVEDALADASTNASNARKAVNAYKAAYNADRRVDGHHGSFLAGKLADLYLALAKSAFGSKNYADAADAVRESLNYQPDKPEATSLEQKCMQQATSMLKEAKEHMAKKNHAEARDLARQVVHILPSMDPRSAEAEALAKQATEAARQDGE